MYHYNIGIFTWAGGISFPFFFCYCGDMKMAKQYRLNNNILFKYF